MRISILITAILFLTSCQSSISNKHQVKPAAPFYVGTYTGNDSQGIYKHVLNSDGTLELIGLAAKSDNPSFLALSAHKKFLVVCNEINSADGKGTVESYSVEGDSLKLISSRSSGGAHPCFVTVSSEGNVLVANYTGGNIGLLQLNGKGELSNLLDVQQHTGKGTTKRQKAPYAHSAWFVHNKNEVIAIDLGTNELWFYTINAESHKLIPTEQQKLNMVDGAGPRHLTFHPNGKWIYVINELDATVSLIQKNIDGLYEIKFTITTIPADYKELNYCADIHISSDGKFVYASNRGHNSIVIYNVNDNNGELTTVGYEMTRGDWPRNFSLSPNENYLLVANQHTNNLVSFKRNKDTGLLTFVDKIESPTPVCILFE